VDSVTDPADGGTKIELDWSTLMSVLDATVSRATFWYVAGLLEGFILDDDEIEAIQEMPVVWRQKATASLLQSAETIREASRTLDAQLLLLTDGE
jgi:hypothetical protein